MIALKLIMLPVVGALIGWGTNVLAIKLIFRPLQPVKLPLLPYTFQGLIPKRRTELARSIARTIENELFSLEDLLQQITEPQMKSEIRNTIITVVHAKVKAKIPPYIPQMLRQRLLDYIVDTISQEMDGMLDHLLDKFLHDVEKTVNIKTMVEERINGFALDKLERLIFNIAARELKAIEILGGVIGFGIGLAQAGLLLLFP